MTRIRLSVFGFGSIYIAKCIELKTKYLTKVGSISNTQFFVWSYVCLHQSFFTMTFDSLRIKLGRDAWTQLFNSLISRLDHQLCALSMAQPLEARLRRGVHHSHRQGDQAQRWKVLLLHARIRGVAEPECRRLAHIQNQGAYLFTSDGESLNEIREIFTDGN